jgi:hypothetical protein
MASPASVVPLWFISHARGVGTVVVVVEVVVEVVVVVVL